jgi:conjugative transfer signal peptidase TraF
MKKLDIITMVAMGCLTVVAITASLVGIRINSTGSYPRGIYWMTNAPITKGSLVIFCPADTAVFRQAKERGYIGAGFCPGGTGYMIKKILAAANDRVEMTNIGVFVNGALLPNSKSMDTDLEGRPLSPVKADIKALDDRSVLLMSDYSPKSFDARYFGLMDRAQIISMVRPVWVWETK